MEKPIKGIVNADVVCIDVADMVYNQGKAKIFNVLESQLEGQKLYATKRIVEDILTTISRNTASYLKDILGDWETEVEAGGLIDEQTAAEAQLAYQKVKDVIGI